ncbi:MAG: hypothetical protein PHI90_06130 [Clostridia bacterium]|nr:hypothetical protein [Clostridia bacterium]
MIGIRIKEIWNQHLRFGRSGLWLILFELVVFTMLVIGVRKTFINFGISLETPDILGFLVFMNFLLTLGNSYITSEKMLFGFRARINQFLAVNSKSVILSTVVITYFSSLRPTLQSPTIIAVVLAHLWFPELQLQLVGMLFAVPFFGGMLAVLTVILVKRYVGWMSGLGLITATAFHIIGIVGVVWATVNMVKGATVIDLFWINSSVFQPMVWWLPLLFSSGLLVYIVLVKLARLWEQAVWIQEAQAGRRLGKNQARGILSLLSVLHLSAPVKAVIVKEWLFLWRNPLTIFRIIVWAILSLILLIYGLSPFVAAFISPLILVFVIWYFCFGELIATAYQAETNRLGLLWMSAISPIQLALGKFLAYLPLAFIGTGIVGLMVFIFDLQGISTIISVVYTFVGLAVGLVLSLAFASLSMNKVNNHGNSITEMALEQVPLTLFSIISIIILGGFLAIVAFLIIWSVNAVVKSTISLCVGIIIGFVVLGVLGFVTTKYLLKWRYSL